MVELFVKVRCRNHSPSTQHDVFVSVAVLAEFAEVSSQGWTDEPCCVDEIVRKIEGRK